MKWRKGRTLAQMLEDRCVVDANGCWAWTGNIDTARGYGRLNVNGKILLAHRVCYELLRGPVDPRLPLDHLCRNRACINPDHLEPVTDAENIRRGLQGVLKTHCKRGHPWVPENIVSNGLTQAGNVAHACRICRCESSRNRRARV